MGVTPVLPLDDDAEFRGMVADELRAARFGPAEAATVAQAEALVLRGMVRSEALLLGVTHSQGARGYIPSLASALPPPQDGPARNAVRTESRQRLPTAHQDRGPAGF